MLTALVAALECVAFLILWVDLISGLSILTAPARAALALLCAAGAWILARHRPWAAVRHGAAPALLAL
ncbi:MAG: hypothetical protein V3U83_01010, partial [Acidobacteriota bacterium]